LAIGHGTIHGERIRAPRETAGAHASFWDTGCPPLAPLTHSMGVNMTIPKILHQTWKTHSLPANYHVLQQWLKQLHPTWEYGFYDDAACREFVCQQMPSLLPLYDQYPTHIQRIDVFRLVAVYVLGGFYLDLDIVCHQRLDALCQHGAVFAEERTLSAAEAEALG